MASPKITWYTKLVEDDEFEAGQQFYAGTYTDDNPIMLEIHLWNNRYGATDVDDLKDFELEFYFDKEEDSKLLDYCSIAVKGKEETTFRKVGNRGIVQFSTPITISGKKNDGDPETDTENYIALTFKFSAYGKNLKENDLKSLFMEVVPH